MLCAIEYSCMHTVQTKHSNQHTFFCLAQIHEAIHHLLQRLSLFSHLNVLLLLACSQGIDTYVIGVVMR